MRGAACQICDTLEPDRLLELDRLIGDPSAWPRTFKNLRIPEPMPRGYRLWGATKVSRTWLKEHGYTFSPTVYVRHARYCVKVTRVDPLEYIDQMAGGVDAEPGPVLFQRYLRRSLSLAVKALDEAERQVDESIAEKRPLPITQLLKFAELALKVSTARIEGERQGAPAALEGFRAGSLGLPSPRMGHARIRVLEPGGEAVPIHDEGPADRERYNAQAEQDGGIRIGGR